MIKAIDEMLEQWAAELHPPAGCEGTRGRSIIGVLMDNHGELMRRTQGGHALWSFSADIELIVNKHLPAPLQRLAWVHYTDHDSPASMKWERCGCSRSQYYRRLGLLHAAISEWLVRRRKVA